jgi:hypothetical protein
MLKMKRREPDTIWAILLALALFTIVSCVLDEDKTAKRGSEVENELYGVLVAMDGKPMPGALVKALPLETGSPKRGAAAGADSTLTDAAGRYAFNDLAPGRYNLFGDYASGQLVVLIPDVNRLDTSKKMDLGTDTLRAPGRIRGRLTLDGRGFGGTLAYIPGSSYLAVSDDSGGFVISGVPQGIHTVRYSAAGFVIEPDTGVIVLSGKTTDVPWKRLAHDPALPPPAPQGLRAVYDTLNERVILDWDSVSVSDLEGYVVYRGQPPQLDPVIVNGRIVTGTTFIDSTLGFASEMESKPLVYRVKSRDKGSNYSLNFSPSAQINAVSKAWVTTRISKSVPSPDSIVTVGDTVKLKIAFENPTRRIREIAWFAAPPAVPLRIRRDSVLSGSDSLEWSGFGPGASVIEARITDDAGAVSVASFGISVLLDPPTAMAGPDTTVTPGDSVRLHGRGEDGFGRIVAWEWACGQTRVFKRSAMGDTILILPAGRTEATTCVLRVTDDDGNSALDTLEIRVIPDLPHAMAGTDTTVTPGDTVRLKGRGVDSAGRIVGWEWACGQPRVFTRSATGDTVFVLPAGRTDGATCVLRVTDDDGNTALDSLEVAIDPDIPTATAGSDTLVSIRDMVRLRGAAFDRLGSIADWEWDIGGEGRFVAGRDGSISFQAPGDPAEMVCVFRVTDDDGNRITDTVRVRVVADEPVADAGPDRTATIGDKIILAGKGTDGFGRIAKLEWDFGGSGSFAEHPPGNVEVTLPSAPRSVFPAILRVTDDDGRQDLDTAFIDVLLDQPIATAGSQAGPFIEGDTVRLTAKGSRDGLGSLAKIEWKVGASGAFSQSGMDTAIVLRAGENPLPCVLRVTDDDGLIALDTVEIPFTLKDVMSWAKAKDNIGFHLSRHICNAAVFQGKMWLVGNAGANGSTYSSTDGKQWAQGAAGGFPAVYGGSATVFKDRLWVFEMYNFDYPDTTSGRIWSSSDGVHWIKNVSSPPYGRRGAMNVVAFKDKLWLFGGGISETGQALNDIWTSEDGLIWVKSAKTLPITPNSDSYPLLVHEDKLYMFDLGTGDVWNSLDGESWAKLANVGYIWTKTPVSYGGKIWLIGGGWYPDLDPLSYSSPDGINWTPGIAEPGFTPRVQPLLLNYDGKIWIMGSDTPVWAPNPSNPPRDVWYTQ